MWRAGSVSDRRRAGSVSDRRRPPVAHAPGSPMVATADVASPSETTALLAPVTRTSFFPVLETTALPSQSARDSSTAVLPLDRADEALAQPLIPTGSSPRGQASTGLPKNVRPRNGPKTLGAALIGLGPVHRTVCRVRNPNPISRRSFP